MVLRDLPPLLRDEPGFASVLGRSTAVLAVPEAARALVVAGLSTLSSRRPIVVAVPTSGEADRLANDLRAFFGADGVESFPAWETLPFERVSPSVETMGRRLRAHVAPARPGRAPRVLVAPVRALVQRLGPHVEDIEPVVVAAGERRDQRGAGRRAGARRLPPGGGRRAPGRAGRAGLDRRRVPVHRRPPGAHRPLGRRGRPAQRVRRGRPALHRRAQRVELFGCRELLPTEAVRERAAELVALEPWGREQWERLSEGQTFDGMESWLPWLAEEEQVLLDLVGDDALVLLVEPRRMRDRAADLLAEEADLASEPGPHLGGGRRRGRSPGSTWRSTGSSPTPRPPSGRSPPCPRVPTSPPSSRWASPPGPVIPTGACWPAAPSLQADGYRLVVAADGEGSADRIGELLHAATACDADDRGRSRSSGAASSRRAKLAVLAEHDLTGRRRAHRQARARQPRCAGVLRRPQGGRLRRAPPARRGPLRAAWSSGRSAGHERDYLLLEYRGDDKLYVPSDQIDAVRHYTGGERPTLSRLGGTDWQKTKARVRSRGRRDRPGARRPLPEADQQPGPRVSRRTRRGRTSWRTPSRSRRRPTS